MVQPPDRKQNPEDGYELWLRYAPISPGPLWAEYQGALTQAVIPNSSPTFIVTREELTTAVTKMLGRPLSIVNQVDHDGTLVLGTPQSSPLLAAFTPELKAVGNEGYLLTRCRIQDKDCIAIVGNTDLGVLYGVFHFLRHLQTHQSLHNLKITSTPRIKYRMLDHWDNLDRTIERGYAGFSIWDWHKLPDYLSPQYKDYARIMASIGLNGSVLTNVNASALVLTKQYLTKVAALADLFRSYGIHIYLTARFSAPIEIGGLTTADPLDPDVIAWWKVKVKEIYDLIPDFGGFVVKANSEGQPGPHDYKRSHADGANLLANALAPYNGIVSWRAFVYDENVPDDRAKQAYHDLVPQDGTFLPNVLLQVKNGPIDFQPREPYHPMFGAMPRTPLALEVQITQEYLGCATHLVYLAPLFKETLDSDTYCYGSGSTVAKVVDGSLDDLKISGIAAVSNVGSERNWCGHPFAAANWFAYGRLTWDHTATSEDIADDWLRMTFSNDDHFVEPAKAMMIESREAVVNYMTPLGLHHIMAHDHHYGPGPWVEGGRADWTSLYYHRADAVGVGFDRSPSGSDAVSQYCSPYRERVGNLATCPDELLLWFHHVPWTYPMQSGQTLWDELCDKYQTGIESVHHMQQIWDSLADFVDEARFKHVQTLLSIQAKEARWWRDACLLYFQTFSNLPIPGDPPAESLEYYMHLEHYYVPGIPERRFRPY
ncbi:MAG TPA: alpha-glucuronidase family glycosyl hydrolase [Aggregatilineaceae bacterium]|nr:alpha-glucuronidase family glycosyl hydrolase [Aggregatilineaceae bacterium]